ncbi:MAG: hypothetical protein M9953_05295 [Thermomicrobiales bacterium]|nr:hypothetical protein [Thermomicrobiales bacterium]
MAQTKSRVKSTGELISSSIRTRLWVLFGIVALKPNMLREAGILDGDHNA